MKKASSPNPLRNFGVIFSEAASLPSGASAAARGATMAPPARPSLKAGLAIAGSYRWLAGRFLVPARKFSGHNFAALIAVALLLAGVIGSRASQTIPLQTGWNYVACEVAGTGGNDLNNPAFATFPPGFSDPNGVINAVLYYWTGTGYNQYQYFTAVDAENYFLVFPGVDGWYDAVGNMPTGLILNPGQGAIIRKFTGGTASMILNGSPLAVPVAKTLVPGYFYLLGSQVSGSGIFDNVVGHPATFYTQIEVYRYTISGPTTLPGSLTGTGGFDLYTCTAGVWTPSAPVLNANESAFIRIPGFIALAVWPAKANSCSTSRLIILGSDFNTFNSGAGDTVKLTGSGLSTPISGTSVTVINDLQMGADFNLSSATPGAVLDVEVTKGGVTKIITGKFQVTPLAISAVVPNQTGNCGFETLTFVGTGICPGATMTLRDSINPDITVTTGVVNSDGTAITALFDLTGVALGSRNVIIVNPSGSTVTAAGAFSVVAPVPAQIDVQLGGPPKIGANRKQYFQVLYRNTGNCASASATSVKIELTGIPGGVTLADLSGAVSATLISGGFSFTVPSVSSSPGYSYFQFSLQPAAGGSFPYNVTLTANSLAPYPDTATKTVQAVSSYDPNDKFGLSGVGANHYITGSELLPYAIHYENKPSASAPAQQVFVTDQLDTTKLDLSTFSLGPITFGTQTINPPPGLKNFTTDVLFDVDGNPATGADDIIVRIVANLDTNPLSANYGRFTCNYLSIDPLTGLLPVDPTRGFLPPNVTQPKGEGSVLFTISAKPGLVDGTTIANGATIVFDVNAPIVTPVWENTIDQSKPVSAVAALPAVSTSTAFNVTWSGTDAGSGITGYDVLVSDNGGAATVWLTGTTATSGLYPGANGHIYQFSTVARDALGNVEAAPATPDATITVNTSTLQIERVGDQVRVTWSGGVLEESRNLPGGWADAAVQVSPWMFKPTEEKQFFRVHAQ